MGRWSLIGLPKSITAGEILTSCRGLFLCILKALADWSWLIWPAVLVLSNRIHLAVLTAASACPLLYG